jgi:murein DD-endopeptidase MepM/ murein hydrolase activator NlpD
MTRHETPEIGDPETAALQVGLRERGLYAGTTDGILGAGTRDALRRLQRRAGLPANGLPTPATLARLGVYSRSAPLGARLLRAGAQGWDVAALQFSLAWHGFPSGPLDGLFGARTDSALRRFQAWAGLPQDGTVGPEEIAKLRAPPLRSPLRLARPSAGLIGDGFGPRGDWFHAGVDFVAKRGGPVVAAAAGRVAFAGWSNGGWGRMVIIEHRAGVRTLYAHLSRIRAPVGGRVATGTLLGLVGMSGRATGPHLHFEVQVRGAAVDPLTALNP